MNQCLTVKGYKSFYDQSQENEITNTTLKWELGWGKLNLNANNIIDEVYGLV